MSGPSWGAGGPTDCQSTHQPPLQERMPANMSSDVHVRHVLVRWVAHTIDGFLGLPRGAWAGVITAGLLPECAFGMRSDGNAWVMSEWQSSAEMSFFVDVRVVERELEPWRLFSWRNMKLNA